MKEFRIAKCIDDNGKGISRYVIFNDGSRKKKILVDKDGNEYIEIDNWIQSDSDIDDLMFKSMSKLARYSFLGKPKDMIESIRKGYGDVIYSKIFFVKMEGVIYFLDRKVGDELRKKTIEGWKNTKFCYGLFYNSQPIDINGCYDWDNKNTFFDTTKDAKILVQKLIDDAFDKASSLIGLVWDDNAEYIKFIDSYLQSPFAELVCDFLEDIHAGEKFKFKENISKEKVSRSFRITQKIDERPV